MTASQFGQNWPLLVGSGYVDCLPVSTAVFKTGGVTYALNGFAVSKDYVDIDPIWKDHPELQGMKADIGPLIDAALALCD